MVLVTLTMLGIWDKREDAHIGGRGEGHKQASRMTADLYSAGDRGRCGKLEHQTVGAMKRCTTLTMRLLRTLLSDRRAGAGWDQDCVHPY